MDDVTVTVPGLVNLDSQADIGRDDDGAEAVEPGMGNSTGDGRVVEADGVAGVGIMVTGSLDGGVGTGRSDGEAKDKTLGLVDWTTLGEQGDDEVGVVVTDMDNSRGKSQELEPWSRAAWMAVQAPDWRGWSRDNGLGPQGYLLWAR